MKPTINLYSENYTDIKNILNKYSTTLNINKDINKWIKEYNNPIEMVDLIGIILDNNTKYKINIWISLDRNLYLNVNDTNSEKIIRYLFERYPN